MKNVLSSIPTMYILAIRFCGAALLLFPVCIGRFRSLDRGYLIGGALMGVALLLGYVFQTYGLEHTTPGKNAFLTSAYCVIVPFLSWLALKKKPDGYNATAALICVAGIGFICLDGNLSIGLGDSLTLICGLFYAIHIITTARFVNERDPAALAVIQFAVAGITALLCALLFETPPSSITRSDLLTMFFLTAVSTAGCLLLQVFGQKYTPPPQAAVIMTLEAVFGAASSAFFFNEAFSFRVIIGFILTFIAVVISETKLSFLRRSESAPDS